MEDKNLICEDCNQEFVFTASEQEFFQEKGFSAPKRCKACREKRKEDKRNNKFSKREN